MRRPAALLCFVVIALGWCSAVAFAQNSTTTTTSPESTTTASSTTSTTDASTTTTGATTTTTSAHAATRRAAAVPQAQSPGDAVVTIKSGTGACLFCFSPADLTIPAGASVTFTNKSGTDHTVARCTPAACNGVSGGTGTDTTFSNSTVAVPVGVSFDHTFANPGTYVYYCTIHGYAIMHGTITVTAATTTTTATAAAPATATTAAPVVDTVNPLASTGASSEPLVLIGIVVLLAGVAAVAFGSRRRTRH
jgi:LPXTG-motif cell wall-anchored protein